ncbi:MAG: nucleotide exchange factor GrpE [Burkholderiaceae bacterium]
MPAGTVHGGVEPAQGAPDEIATEQARSGPDARLAEAQAQVAEVRDQYLRAVAELDNVRRRAQDDVAKAHKYGIETFAESLLPVKDSLEMALKADAPSVDNLKEGVEATLRLLASAFEKNRLFEIDPQGEKFDPNRHQAISTVPAAATQPPIAPNHVAHVLQKGYLIGDRVLRPALVTVVQG